MYCQRMAVWLLLAVMAFARCMRAQTGADAQESEPAFRMRVAVDEVVLTFHAADAHGLPVNDLKLNELSFLDNGKPPRRVLGFHLQQDFPIRAGLVIDTSESMRVHLAVARKIAIQYTQRLLRQETDQAFVMEFGYASKFAQAWTSDSKALSASIGRVAIGKENPLGGTTVFDTVYRACFNEFGKIDHAASGNFILLFSDGEDNASHTSLKDAVDVCQRANTAIYAFRAESKPGSSSTGPGNLAELASETGGRVFHEDDSEDAVYTDLRVIEGDLRNQYRLVYNPAELKHDGAFHRIVVKTPDRVESLQIRSGYYAPTR